MKSFRSTLEPVIKKSKTNIIPWPKSIIQTLLRTRSVRKSSSPSKKPTKSWAIRTKENSTTTPITQKPTETTTKIKIKEAVITTINPNKNTTTTTTTTNLITKTPPYIKPS